MKTTVPYILMLEDDADDQHITLSFFREQNHDIHLEFVTNPAEVVPFLDNCGSNSLAFPHLIILDKYMAAGSSVATLMELKAHPMYRKIPVVIISGSDWAEDIEECYRLGANSYIVKPQRDGITAKKIATFVSYWFEVAELPDIEHRRSSRTFA